MQANTKARVNHAGHFITVSLLGIGAMLLMDTWSTWRADQDYQAVITSHQVEYDRFIGAMREDMLAFQDCNAVFRRGDQAGSQVCIQSLAESATSFGVLHLTAMLVDKYQHQYGHADDVAALTDVVLSRALDDLEKHRSFIEAHDNRLMVYQSSMLPWLSSRGESRSYAGRHNFIERL
ncbi:hypothetical protein ACKF11_13585 [Methylobacillus sp. Pita2]|uniref:hypothetical protein n=1 Tax=Methylobacillus sp. Pita2 TaxID=3383245 RepID=UPI0038B5F8BE